jgi:MFS family permease
LALYNFGTTVGIVLAYLLIGSLIPARDVEVPGVGTLRPWQFVFFLLGLPGIVYGLVLLGLREPVRRNLMAGQQRATYGDTLRFMWVRRDVFVPLLLGMAMLALLVYGPASQTVLFMTRTFHWSIPRTAVWNGFVLLAGGLPGAFFGGWLASRLRARGRAEGTLRAMFLATCGLTVPVVIAYVMPTPELFWLLSCAQNFCIAASINLGSAAIADITPNQLRGKAVAIQAVLLTMIGLGAGPSLIALITQHVVGDEQAIRYSLSIFGAVVAPLAILAFAVALPAFRRVATEAAGWTGVAAR